MLDRRDDSPWAERRAKRPPAALVVNGRGSTGVTSYRRGRQREHRNRSTFPPARPFAQERGGVRMQYVGVIVGVCEYKIAPL